MKTLRLYVVHYRAGVEHLNAEQPNLINPLSSLNFRQRYCNFKSMVYFIFDRWPLGEDISSNVNEHKIKVKNKHYFKT